MQVVPAGPGGRAGGSLDPAVGLGHNGTKLDQWSCPDGLWRPDMLTIGIRDLAHPASLDSALATSHGFVQLAPGALSCSVSSWLDFPNTQDADWTVTGGNQVRPIGPLGCTFLRDVSVTGSGYFFSEGRFIREHTHTSDVALQWLNQPDFPDNPFTTPRTNHITIDEPVLLVFGPGANIFGHWLLDFLPRIDVAQRLLGARLDPFVLLLPQDAPSWVERMIGFFCGIGPERIRRFNRMKDQVLCREVCLPSFAHNGDYAFHTLLRDFYQGIAAPATAASGRRICLSRRNQEKHTHSYWRIFEAREALERKAVAHGFEIVQPELLDFADQVALFHSAGCILGEHGSGMHAAVFANPGTLVATIGANNDIQFKIAGAFGHRSLCMRRLQTLEDVPGKPTRFTASEDDLERLLAKIDDVI